MDKYPPSESEKQITSDPIRIQRGLYQGDSLSPLWFCLALNPLSYLLNRKNYGFGVHSGNQEIQRLNHLIYIWMLLNYMQLQTLN